MMEWSTLILAVLTDGPRHGYDIAREVERRAEHEIVLLHGTLYAILHQMERDGLICSEWDESSGERRRRNYTVTPAGLDEFLRRMRKWEAVNRVLGIWPRGAQS